MRRTWILCFVMGAALAACAKEPKPFQTAKLLQMNSVHCGTAEKSDKSALSEIIGSDDTSRKTEDVLCQEYVLQTESVTYRIRPKDQKHPELLPVGSMVQFRIDKDKLLLRAESVDDKERDYIVVSMTPRSGTENSPSPAQSQASIPSQTQ